MLIKNLEVEELFQLMSHLYSQPKFHSHHNFHNYQMKMNKMLIAVTKQKTLVKLENKIIKIKMGKNLRSN